MHDLQIPGMCWGGGDWMWRAGRVDCVRHQQGGWKGRRCEMENFCCACARFLAGALKREGGWKRKVGVM
jgi:hypothetical protein